MACKVSTPPTCAGDWCPWLRLGGHIITHGFGWNCGRPTSYPAYDRCEDPTMPSREESDRLWADWAAPQIEGWNKMIDEDTTGRFGVRERP